MIEQIAGRESPAKGLLKKGIAARALVAEGVHATVIVDGDDGPRQPLSTPLRIRSDTIARGISTSDARARDSAELLVNRPTGLKALSPRCELLPPHFAWRPLQIPIQVPQLLEEPFEILLGTVLL